MRHAHSTTCLVNDDGGPIGRRPLLIGAAAIALVGFGSVANATNRPPGLFLVGTVTAMMG